MILKRLSYSVFVKIVGNRMVKSMNLKNHSLEKGNGYNQLFYSPAEYVETKFSSDGEVKNELKKRGLPCPK